MELKKEYLGTFVFIKALHREVEVIEENMSILLQHNQRQFFVYPKPEKVEKPKKTKVEKPKEKTEEKK